METTSHQTVHSIQTASGRILDVVRQATDSLQILSLRRSAEACRVMATQHPFIDVAVLGQFKAGKSSFLNSLIGRRLLPVGVIPVTTVITRIQYGAVERAVVTLFDGTRTEISLYDLDAYSEAKPGKERRRRRYRPAFPGGLCRSPPCRYPRPGQRL